jgi:quinol monooxygenase YgiN
VFCVVYQWKVKPGKENMFRQTWREITEAIFAQHGSLGSRLHRAEDGSFVAYAQWPDETSWSHVSETVGVDLARANQVQCLEAEMNIIFKLMVTDDLLRSAKLDSI